jgi:hypothetical protein
VRRYIVIATIVGMLVGGLAVFMGMTVLRPEPGPVSDSVTAGASDWQTVQGTLYLCDSTGRVVLHQPITRIQDRTPVNPGLSEEITSGCEYYSCSKLSPPLRQGSALLFEDNKGTLVMWSDGYAVYKDSIPVQSGILYNCPQTPTSPAQK